MKQTSTFNGICCFILTATAATFAPSLSANAAEPTAAQLEFFEKKIRPVLIDNCYECHAADAKKVKGGLLLDSRWGWQQQGDSKKVVIAPGDPAGSMLIKTIKHELPGVEMPPKKKKLSQAVIADFEKWIEMGAPDPREKKQPHAAAENEDAFDLAERKQWWSLQPPVKAKAPMVRRNDWPRNDYDRFILAALESKGWKPADEAGRRSWIRRVTYDLTGLPPKPEDVNAFLTDMSPEAHEKVVDRLLASPQYGEHWGRHWLDLVRYAETKAFEQDYTMPNVYQYRDYIIRAFNDDVPYNQMLLEAMAGDLLAKPRINEKTGINESVAGPGFFYLTNGQHGPPDIHADEVRVIDDMINVVGKAFMGYTIACARCHDHKFDAITAGDYYALYGVMTGSRLDHANNNPPAQMEALRSELRNLKPTVRRAIADVIEKDVATVTDDWAAVAANRPATPQQLRWANVIKKPANDATKTLARFVLEKDAAKLQDAWNQIKDAKSTHDPAKTIGRMGRNDFGGWLASGRSFADQTRTPGDFVIAPDGEKAITTFVGGRAAAGHLSSRFAGAIKSPDFLIADNTVSVRVKGKNVRVSLIIHQYELVGRGPTTKGLTKVINSDKWTTVTFGTNLWKGARAYFDIIHNGGEIDFASRGQHHANHVDGSYAAVDHAVNGGRIIPNNEANPWGITQPAPASREAMIAHFAAQTKQLAAALRAGKMTAAQNDLLEALHEAGVFDFNINRTPALRKAVEEYRALQARVPKPTYVRSLTDGHGRDEPVYIRGSHHLISDEPNPRAFLEAFDPEPFPKRGSGRIYWAERLASRDNPLTARTMVNRIWHHLFGRGIVASVDDLGMMGSQPTHPQLLDRLAVDFMDDGWSIKRMIRKIVLSSTYRMSTTAAPEALRDDPDNLYLQRMPIRRLTAESVRDTILAVSGDLDLKMFGQSVPVNLFEAPGSRSRPGRSGPLNGAGRRSIYLEMRRNYLPRFLLAFDMPNASEPFGRRNVTNVPAQSLAMMNDPFVAEQARFWARRILEDKNMTFEQRIEQIHQRAFVRSATEKELAWAQSLLDRLAEVHDVDPAAAMQNEDVWADLCHAMLNRKELIYVY